MRKVISLLLSIAMLVTMVSVLTTTASAAQTEVEAISFDNALERTSVFQIAWDSNAAVGIAAVDGLDNPGGKVAKVRFGGQANNKLGVTLTPGWKLTTPVAIKFWAKTTEPFADLRVGLTGTTAKVGSDPSDLVNLPLDDATLSGTGRWYTADLSGVADLTAYNSITFGYKSGTQSTTYFYVDNITFVYADGDNNVFKLADATPYTLYDWEENSTGATAAGNTFTRNTSAIATSLVPSSTYGLKVTGSYSNNAKYMKVAVNDGTHDLDDAIMLRVALLYANTKDGNPVHIGVQVDGVNYWKKFTSPQSSFAWTYIDGATYADSSSNKIYIDRSNLTDIDYLLFSFGDTYSNFYIDDIQYIKALEPTAPVVDPYEDIAGTTNVAAQLRIGAVNGIRFITNIDSDLVAQAKADGYTVTMGTLIAPLESGELTLDTDPVLDIPTTGWYANNEGEIAASIVNIKETNITKDFVARGYVKLEKEGEDTKVYYATQPTEGRSLKTVAGACVADNSFFNMLNDAQKEQVTTWATWANA